MRDLLERKVSQMPNCYLELNRNLIETQLKIRTIKQSCYHEAKASLSNFN